MREERSEEREKRGEKRGEERREGRERGARRERELGGEGGEEREEREEKPRPRVTSKLRQALLPPSLSSPPLLFASHALFSLLFSFSLFSQI